MPATLVEEMAKKATVAMLPVNKLYASPRNPRKIVDDPSQRELNADVRVHGVMVPLIGRKVKDRYEILAGSRRLHAAKAAKMTALPVRVVEVDDVQAHEIMVVENLQRKDIHPIDEAENFQLMLEKSNGDVLALEKRVNKSARYIKQALALNTLLPKIKERFRKGQISRDTAFAIARLQAIDQERLMKDADENGGLNLSDVMEWTERNVLRDLARVPWDVKDPDLWVKAGPCATCPKKAGIAKDLFNDVASGDTCTDSACFETKTSLHLQRQKGELGTPGVHYRLINLRQYETKDGILGTKDYQDAGDKKCEKTVIGLIAAGDRVGHTMNVCTDLRCKTHRIGMSANSVRVSAAEREKLKEARQGRADEMVIRDKVLTEIVNQTTAGLDCREMEMILGAVFGRLWHEHKKRYLKRHGLIKPPSKVKVEATPDYDALFRTHVQSCSAPQFARSLIEIALIDEVDPGVMDVKADRLYALAKSRKVDVARIKADLAERKRQEKLAAKKKRVQ